MHRAGVAVFLAVCFVFTGCKSSNNDSSSGNDPGDPGQPPGGGVPPANGIALELQGDPTVTWKDTNGKTTLVTQFAVRDSNGVPLEESQFVIQMLVDDEALDDESLLDQSSEELAVNLYYSMVLDASYSMTQHSPPAFEPMKEAARDSYQTVLDTWAARPGDTKFSLIWFSEVLNQNTFNANTGRDWRPDDILSIPAPTAGESTKLLAATERMAQYLTSEYQSGVFAEPRDQYVMLLFSDGKDNYSWFDNSSIDGSFATSSGATYRQSGATPTTLDGVKAAIAANPKLTVHVIGLGSKINKVELEEIAAAGGGVFLENPSSDNIDDLFDRVLQEFLTIQTQGAEMPLPPSDYKFTLRVTDLGGNYSAEQSYNFHAGDDQARILGPAN